MGKGLRETLVQKVTKEKGNIRGYLFELTRAKANDIQQGIKKIKDELGKPTHSLLTFVDYILSLKVCKN